MTVAADLRSLAPRVLAAVARRCGDIDDAEDAVQEAMVAAATTWPAEGTPDNPSGWLIRVAMRRLADQYRSDDARRRREDVVASRSLADPPPAPSSDDTLILMLMCCHPSLTPGAAIPLTLRAVGGLTTVEIASAFFVPEATMGQRISRAKATIRGTPFSLPPVPERGACIRSVLHVLYLIFNEGYASTAGPSLGRADLADEAIRLTRMAYAALPDDPEVAGLLALMLLTDARRRARTQPDGALVSLASQDRRLWDRALILEGVTLITAALRMGQIGEYQLQAAIAACHDQSPSDADTDWLQIMSLYGLLEKMTRNPMVALNLAVAASRVHGATAGLQIVDGLSDQLRDHHRLHAVRGHLLEQAGDANGAIAEFKAAAARTTNAAERDYLTTQAARLTHGG